MVEGFALGVVAFTVVMFFICLCCRICAIMQENDTPTRPRRARQRRQQRGHDRMLVAVIPVGDRDGWSTPPTYDTSFWGPSPPPYSPPENGFPPPDTSSSPDTGPENISEAWNISPQVPLHDEPSSLSNVYSPPGPYTPAEIAARLDAASPPPYEPPPAYI